MAAKGSVSVLVEGRELGAVARVTIENAANSAGSPTEARLRECSHRLARQP